VAYKHLNAHGGSDCDWLRLHIDWHLLQIYCNQLGSCVDENIVELIAISSDCVLMDVESGFDGGLDGGFGNWFHLVVLGYQPQQSV
jgi:hypothetical protein